MFLDVFMDALIDTVKMLPFLYLACLAIEAIEHSHGDRIEQALAGGGRWGCAAGAVLGCIPQCGFSAMAANLYGGRVITLGTLMAVFLATSDEAIPLLVALPGAWKSLGLLVAMKLVFALAAGLCLDVLFKGLVPRSLRGGYTGHADEVDCHEKHEEKVSIWRAALRHTAELAGFILLFSLVIGLIFEAVGQEAAAGFLGSLGVFQPLFTALIGLVPNCAASVLLTQLYLSGGIGFPARGAGLCSGAGVGLAVLYRSNPSLKQNLFITLLLWGLGAGCGMLLALLGL